MKYLGSSQERYTHVQNIEKHKLLWRNHLERITVCYRTRKRRDEGIPLKKVAQPLLRFGIGPCSLILGTV
jgi:hypothetical protein